MGSPMLLGGLGPGSVAPPAKSLWTFRIRLAGLSLGMQHQHCPPMGSLVRPCLTQSLPHQCQARHRQAQWGALSSAGDPNQASEELQCPQADSHSSGSPPQPRAHPLCPRAATLTATTHSGLGPPGLCLHSQAHSRAVLHTWRSAKVTNATEQKPACTLHPAQPLRQQIL